MKKLLKVVGIIALILIAAFLITGLFVNGDIHIEREVSINKDKASVFNYIKFMEHQKEFSVWHKIDPDQVHIMKGTDGTVGAIHSWVSKNDSVGEGEQEIKSIIEGDRIDFELRFQKPDEMSCTAYFTTKVDGIGTKVLWGFDMNIPYPFNAFMLFTDMDEMLGPDLQGGLNNLKSILEKE
ncbi:MAG: SRPBCC family protein [Flavobacteriales bacterium]|nr:SRPBCC family protein [Flavobacteriales bacterium]